MRMLMAVLATGLAAGGLALRAEDKKPEPPKPVPATVGQTTKVKIEVTPDWVEQKADARRFRVAQWGIPKADGDAKPPELYFSELTGNGGGVEANVKRWVNEYSPKDSDKRETLEADGFKVIFVEVQGTFQESMGGPFAGGGKTPREGYATLGAVFEIPDADTALFAKMIGPKKSVLAQKEAFKKLLKASKKG
jgi:gluconolactonase